MEKFGKTADQVARALQIRRGKWTVQILYEMRRGPVRLGHLKRTFPIASKKSLTLSLRELENAKLVIRRDLSKSILHVEYDLEERVAEPLVRLLDLLAECAALLPHESDQPEQP